MRVDFSDGILTIQGDKTQERNEKRSRTRVNSGLSGSPVCLLDCLEDASEPGFHILRQRANLFVAGKL
jgi:hypothetical protein